MAVVTRQSLQTKQAQDIKQKAIKRASVYNPVFSQLEQQRTILQGQQQNLMQTTQETIGDVQRNIYSAQRQARASSAGLGMIGSVEAARSATELQDQIGYELGNIVSQSTQGAVSIASQQSAINKAEVMNAQQEILDVYADELISSGDPSVSQDIGAQVMAGLGGAFAGALAGFGVGQFGPKAGNLLKNAGPIKGALGGAAVTMGANVAGTKIATIGQDYWSTEAQESYEDNEWTQRGTAYSAAIGATIGATAGRANSLNSGNKEIRGMISPNASKPGWLTKGLRKGSNIKFKALNPSPLGLAMAGIGATIGGLSAGLDKKYTLDYDKLMQSGTAQDFAAMGIDLESLSGLIKGR